jgi:hypothetical protein
MKPMKAFPDHPKGMWGPPPCSIKDPTWQLCQDDGYESGGHILDLMDHFTKTGSGQHRKSLKNFKKNAIHLRRWRALVELKKAGKIKAIGVSNWMLSNLKRMKSLGLELPAVRRKLQFNVL